MSDEKNRIVEKVRDWIKRPDFTIEDVSDPGLKADEIAIRVRGMTEKDYFGNQKEVQYFVAFPSDIDALFVSSYFYFDKSDASGFTVLPNEYKTKFANEMKIPLLTLGLWYRWIPDLKNIESLQMQKLIYFDGFSRNAFVDGLTRVLNGYEIVSTKYEEFRNSIHKGK